MADIYQPVNSRTPLVEPIEGQPAMSYATCLANRYMVPFYPRGSFSPISSHACALSLVMPGMNRPASLLFDVHLRAYMQWCSVDYAQGGTA